MNKLFTQRTDQITKVYYLAILPMSGCLAKTLLLIDLFAVIKRAHSAATS